MSITISLKTAAVAITVPFFILHCGQSKVESSPPKKNTDPGRCIATDVGEAADFVLQKNIVDDRLVQAQGLTNPQSLVWRDEQTGKTFYLARIMGTEQKLFFLKEVADEAPPPGVSSRFEGRLVRWRHLPPAQAAHMASGLKSQYNIDVKLDEAFLIIEGQKPDGC